MTGQLQFPTPISGAVDPAAGEAAKHDGMNKADANTADDWRDQCDAGIRFLAGLGIEFQAADLVELAKVPEPDHPNRWGPRLAAARRAGVIEPVGYAPSNRATVHRSICRTWRGTPAAQQGRAA